MINGRARSYCGKTAVNKNTRRRSVGLKLGNITLTHALMLAPMAGYTDRAMRAVCASCGAEHSTTEMVSAKAVVYGDKKTQKLAGIRADEGPVSLQIFGSEPAVMAEAAAVLCRGRAEEGYVPPVAIDINMGCPVHKIFGNGEGSALMRDPTLIHDIVHAVRSAIGIPVTVKIRSGIDSSHINAVECALAAESAGAAAVCVHGRTRAQLYGGKADREIIKNVKSALQIPVIANGDITDAASALAMLRDTGADGISVGRAAVGNPYIFSEISAALSGREVGAPTLAEKIEMAKRELRLAVEDKGEGIAIPEARKKIALYFKGFRGSASLRAGINSALTLDAVERLLSALEAEAED